MKKMLLSLFTCLLAMFTMHAQQANGQLDIQFNKNILQPGDSLLITMDYKDGGGQLLNLPLATLELIVENEQGMRTLLRWPVINGQASGTLYLPDSLPPGKYTLLAGLQKRFFEVVGKIKDYKNSGKIQAMILTKKGDWDQQEVPVAPDGSFAIRNWLFEDNALLAFSGTKNNNRPLDIRISTQLDSANAPIAVAGRVFYIGNPPSAMRQTLNQPVETSGAAFTGQADLMPAVLVRTTVKSRAEQFDEAYASGLFRSGNERVISIMDDPAAIGSSNIMLYLQGRVAGLQIAQGSFGGAVASWRGSPVAFFMDEIRVPSQQLASIPMADIAIVKAYPPPFFGAPGGVGAVAIYTRRGTEASYLPANRQVFKVRGYTPAATGLNMKKLSL
jgi:hypothetical protein